MSMSENEQAAHDVTIAARSLEIRDCYCSETNGQPHGEWESPWRTEPPYYCYDCTKGHCGDCTGIAWAPDIECEHPHQESAADRMRRRYRDGLIAVRTTATESEMRG